MKQPKLIILFFIVPLIYIIYGVTKKCQIMLVIPFIKQVEITSIIFAY